MVYFAQHLSYLIISKWPNNKMRGINFNRHQKPCFPVFLNLANPDRTRLARGCILYIKMFIEPYSLFLCTRYCNVTFDWIMFGSCDSLSTIYCPVYSDVINYVTFYWVACVFMQLAILSFEMKQRFTGTHSQREYIYFKSSFWEVHVQ